MIYKRGGLWWFEFVFCGQRIREPAKTSSKTLAREIERQRRREMEEGLHGIKKHRVRLFSVAAEEWLNFKRPHLAPRSVKIEQANLEHLNPVFGKILLGDITPEDVAKYQQARLDEGAAPKTINLEIGTVRAILRRNRLWANIQPDVRMLPVRDDVGQAISHEQEARLLEECNKSRSRSLYPAVTLALSTAMRYSEIRLLLWKQVDFIGKRVWVGESKTEYGEGRPIPMNDRTFQMMTMWAETFLSRQPVHYVFPTEKCGAAGDDFRPCVYGTDPTKPIGDWKAAWEAARKRAGVACRFHDLRHTACTRMLEAGTPLSVVATIMGWSPSTTVRMSRRYGHIGQAAQREAVRALEGKTAKIEGESPQKSPQFQGELRAVLAN
jgi:integrase